MSLVRQPALHFIVIGVALFLWQRQPPAPVTLALSAARVAQLRADLARQTGAAPRADQEAALVAHELDLEILYREALARGLDRGDPSIRRRLADKMRFLSDDGEDRQDEDAAYRQALALGLDRDDAIVRRALTEKMRLMARRAIPQAAPTETALQDYLDRHADQYRQPARIRFSQVFLSRALRGSAAAHDATVLLDTLRSATPPTRARLGDPLPVASRSGFMTAREVEKLFGPDFATQVMAVEPGNWTGPLTSAYGLHLVRIEAREPGQVPALAQVRQQVEQAFRIEQGEQAYGQFIRQLRAAYGVDHAAAAPGAPPRGHG